jgi:hypothetical protein
MPRRSTINAVFRVVLGLAPGTQLMAQDASLPEEAQSDTSRFSDHDLGQDHMAPGEVVMDRVVAVVGSRVLTASNLRLEAALQAHDSSPLPLIHEVPESPLQALIDLALIRHKAGNISLYQPAAPEVRARLYLLRNSWTDPREFDLFLEVWHLEEEDLESLIYTRLVAENFVHRQVILASQGQHESAAALEDRYRSWIEEVRAEIPTRVVPPLDLD